MRCTQISTRRVAGSQVHQHACVIPYSHKTGLEIRHDEDLVKILLAPESNQPLGCTQRPIYMCGLFHNSLEEHFGHGVWLPVEVLREGRQLAPRRKPSRVVNVGGPRPLHGKIHRLFTSTRSCYDIRHNHLHINGSIPSHEVLHFCMER